VSTFKFSFWQIVALCGICLQMIILNIDMTIVNVAIPAISKALHLSLVVSSGMINAYLALTGALLILGAKLANRFSMKRMFLVASFIFLIGSLVCGFAVNAATIIIGRNIQSIGAGLSLTIMSPMLFSIFEKKDFGTVIGILSLCIGVSQAIGPTLGGVLLTYSSWRSIFFLNLPLGLLAMLLTWRYFPQDRGCDARLHDLFSVAFIVVGIFVFVVGLNNVSVFGLDSLNTILPLLVGIFFVAVFVYRQQRVAIPSLNLNIFKVPQFCAMGLSRAVFQYGFYTTLFVEVLYMHFVMHLTAMSVGLILAVKTASFGLLSPVFGALRVTLGDKILQTTGILITCFVACGFAYLATSMTIMQLIVLLLISGVGTGMVMPVTVPSGLSVIAPKDLQMGSAVLYLLMLLGGTLGVGLSVNIIHSAMSHIQGVSLSLHQIFTAHFSRAAVGLFELGVRRLFVLSAALQFLGVLYLLLKAPASSKISN
jgi:EmrB/QacA subfamily drug resistance transporter